jgi:hypothetical protein
VRVALSKLATIQEEFLSLNQVALVMEISPTTAKKLTQADPALPYTDLGGVIKVPRSLLVEWLNSRSKGIEYFDPGYDLESNVNWEPL